MYYYIYDYINDNELTQFCKQSIVEYSQDKSIHTQLECNFEDILSAVFFEINNLPLEQQKLAKQRLNEEMTDSECKCFTGRISRLVNCLSGISDKVIIKISDAEEISNIILIAKSKYTDILEIKEYVRKEMREREYTEELIEY